MKNLLANTLKNPFIQSNDTTGSAGGVRAVIRGLAVAAVVLVLGSLALAVAFCYTQMSSQTCHLLQLLVLALSAWSGGFAAAKHSGSRGLYHGLFLGLLLLVCLCAFSLQNSGVAPLTLLLKALLLLFCGGLGGIFGV